MWGQPPLAAQFLNSYRTPTWRVWENKPMTGVQFVTDGKGRKVAVLIDLKKHGARLADFWDGLISESAAKRQEYRWKR